MNDFIHENSFRQQQSDYTKAEVNPKAFFEDINQRLLRYIEDKSKDERIKKSLAKCETGSSVVSGPGANTSR